MLIEVEAFIKDADLGYEFAVENFIAHFSAEEQASVRLVFQTHEHNIKTDFGIEVPITMEQAATVTIDEQLSQWVAARQLQPN
jgi:hypothetical protein